MHDSLTSPKGDFHPQSLAMRFEPETWWKLNPTQTKWSTHGFGMKDYICVELIGFFGKAWEILIKTSLMQNLKDLNN